jgi:hypothetical protein
LILDVQLGMLQYVLSAVKIGLLIRIMYVFKSQTVVKHQMHLDLALLAIKAMMFKMDLVF